MDYLNNVLFLFGCFIGFFGKFISVGDKIFSVLSF